MDFLPLGKWGPSDRSSELPGPPRTPSTPTARHPGQSGQDGPSGRVVTWYPRGPGPSLAVCAQPSEEPPVARRPVTGTSPPRPRTLDSPSRWLPRVPLPSSGLTVGRGVPPRRGPRRTEKVTVGSAPVLVQGTGTGGVLPVPRRARHPCPCPDPWAGTETGPDDHHTQHHHPQRRVLSCLPWTDTGVPPGVRSGKPMLYHHGPPPSRTAPSHTRAPVRVPGGTGTGPPLFDEGTFRAD